MTDIKINFIVAHIPPPPLIFYSVLFLLDNKHLSSYGKNYLLGEGGEMKADRRERGIRTTS